MRVGDLLSYGALEVRLVAGLAGADRELLWAHSCEMPDPARFLGPNELLMTSGHCVPHDPEEQREFLIRIAEAGLAGLMVAEHDPAPPLSDALLTEADLRGFPVFIAGMSVAYAVVARHVAAANSSQQTQQVLKLSRMYHIATYTDHDLDSLVADLVPVVDAGLALEERLTGFVLARAAHPNAFADQAEHRVQLRGRHGATLVLSEFQGQEVDGFIMAHLMKLLAVAVDSRLNAAQRHAAAAERYAVAALVGTPLPDTAKFMATAGGADGFRAVAFPRESLETVTRAASLATLPVPVGPGRTRGIALVPVSVLDEMRVLLARQGVAAGVSSVFTDFSDARASAAEAASVLELGPSTAASWSVFEGSTLSVLSRSRRESEEIVQGVLGAIADDSPRSKMLRETLFTFLRLDRGWDATAAALNIHRQTLGYRLRQLTSTTGRDLGSTSDLAALWIAAQAWELLHPSTAPADDPATRGPRPGRYSKPLP